MAAANTAAQRKQFGIYYTPADLAQTLVEWAIRSPNDRVLEPSFGGCSFLAAAVGRLRELGASDPARLIYGTDVDRQAIDHLANTVGMVDIRRRFLLQDFLETKREDFDTTPFDVVIGNPPFISNQASSDQQKQNARRLALESKWDLRSTASLWAYFVLHSLSFCAEGGRVAFVLPAAFLLSNYAAVVRDHLARVFERIHVVNLSKRIFATQGADEHCVLLFADEFRARSDVSSKLLYHDSIQAMEESRTPIMRKGIQTLDAYQAVAFSAISTHALRLGELAHIAIGTVTGANSLFVMSAADVNTYEIPREHLKPVIYKLPATESVCYTTVDHRRTALEGARCFLLAITPAIPSTKALTRYLDTLAPTEIATNRTFGKRSPWYIIRDCEPGDALLSYMSHLSPRLTINRAAAACTNNLHRLWWRSNVTETERQMAAIAFVGTFTQLSSELVGRTYGGGVLKLEIAEARSVELMVPAEASPKSIRAIFLRVDKLLRAGQRLKAQALVDDYLLGFYYSVSDRRAILSVLREALKVARERRGSGKNRGE